MPMTDAHVRLEGVVKRFGEVTAVAGVSLGIARGSLTTLLGPSGCGKTTILRLVAGFLEPDAGTVVIDGVPQRGLPPYRRSTSTVFQEYALFPHLTVFDNVAYGLRLRRVPRGQIARQVGEVLEMLRLEGLERRFPRELSGGQQQRVALARSLIVRPEVLLMDEPLSNLDAKLRVAVRAEIREIQQRVGITTLYVTHDQEEALAISDTIAVMRDGRLIQVGTPRDIYERPADPFVAAFVGQVNLLEGAIEGRVVRLGPLSLPIPPGSPEVVSGQRVILALRPEAIRIDAAEGGGQALRGQVTSRIYLGTIVRYQIDVGGDPLVVDDPDPASRPLLEGTVSIRFDPERVRLWPITGEAARSIGEAH